jgi:hypothetical protein
MAAMALPAGCPETRPEAIVNLDDVSVMEPWQQGGGNTTSEMYLG